MILNASEIIELCEKGMITPFEREKVRQLEGEKAISFGTGGFGLDIRLSPENFKICRKGSEPLDPMRDCSDFFQHVIPIRHNGYEVFVIPANSFALCQSVETFAIPDDIHVICTSKSTYVRNGVQSLLSPLEAGWRGILTIELANTAPRPAIVYANQGIAQLMFFRGNPTIPYSGAYQDQAGTMFAKVGK